jgi:hypothetical protein
MIKPPLHIRWHKVETEIADAAGGETNGQGRLMRDAALGVVDAAREKRRTLAARIAKAGRDRRRRARRSFPALARPRG